MGERYRMQQFAGGTVQELADYLAGELKRIELSQDSGFGGATLYRASGTAAPAKTLPASGYVLLDDMDTGAPAREYQRVVPSVADQALYIRDPGLWAVQFAVNAKGLQATRDYQVRVFVNGAITNLAALVDLSNQSVQANFVGFGVWRVSAGQNPVKLDLRISQITPGNTAPWETVTAYFTAFAVGD